MTYRYFKIISLFGIGDILKFNIKDSITDKVFKATKFSHNMFFKIIVIEKSDNRDQNKIYIAEFIRTFVNNVLKKGFTFLLS